mgnify:CR=1 FL=1
MFPKSFFVDWYKEHGRNFPWRQAGVSPFKLLVTEMLLRQTQASSVSKLWYGFTQKYPNASLLAQANEDELFNVLKILGLAKQRSSALSAASTWLVENCEGQVPDTKEELLKIPHVGLYVSNAVLCFAFGQRVEIVDTNVLRFYARYYGLEIRPDIRRNAKVWDEAKSLLPDKGSQVQHHNYGLLDFTAEVCRSRFPQCNICPLASSCSWATRGIKP